MENQIDIFTRYKKLLLCSVLIGAVLGFAAMGIPIIVLDMGVKDTAYLFVTTLAGGTLGLGVGVVVARVRERGAIEPCLMPVSFSPVLELENCIEHEDKLEEQKSIGPVAKNLVDINCLEAMTSYESASVQRPHSPAERRPVVFPEISQDSTSTVRPDFMPVYSESDRQKHTRSKSIFGFHVASERKSYNRSPDYASETPRLPGAV